MKYPLLVLSILLTMASFAPPSASAAEGKEGRKTREFPIFYPPAPAKPRIQFLASYSSEEDLPGKGGGGFQRFVLGGKKVFESLEKPYGVALHDGRLFVCDTGKDYVVIFRLTRKGKRVEYLGKEPPGQLSKPINIVVDKDGTRYVADTGHKRVMVYDFRNRYIRALGDPEKLSPSDVAIDGDRLYVADVMNGEIVVLDKSSGKEIRRFGKTGDKKNHLFFPTNLAVGPKGDLFASDTGSFRISRLDGEGDIKQQIGSIGRIPGKFARPKGIAIDRQGRLYVVDSAFENVQIFNEEGKLLLFFGQKGNVPGGLNLPAKVIVDYDHVDLFRDFVAPEHEIEHLIIVTSQYGKNLVNVYGLLKVDD